jgi:DNA-binding MarR family transcriptional regulator
VGTSSRVPARAELLERFQLAGRRLSAATIMFHQAVADRLGLNITDHKCLDFVLLNGPLTAGELATMTGMTTGAITAVIDRLERAGFVRRADDPTDRRRVIVHAVPKNLGPARKLFEPFAALLEEMTARYSDAEMDRIVDFMTRSCDVLHRSTVELREESPPQKKSAARGRTRTKKA